MTETVRRAKSEDIRRVFEISNDEAVRRVSLHPESIAWERHVEWFDHVLRDENSEFFVAEDGEHRVFAQIRYRVRVPVAIVSISLDAEHRGKGLASKLLEECDRLVFLSRGDLNAIHAEILPNNQASAAAFSKAGYRCISTHHRSESGQLVHLYAKEGNQSHGV